MARIKTATEGKPRFKPEVSVEYSATRGTFGIYEFATKTKQDVNSITFCSLINLMKYESDDFTSNRFAKLFSDPISIYWTSPWAYKGTFKFDKDKKALVDDQGRESGFEGKTALCAIGVLEDGRSCEIRLTGNTKMHLTKVDEDRSNAENVRNFNDSEFITLTPAKDSIEVGTGKKKKDVFLLEASVAEPFELNGKDEEVVDSVNAELAEMKSGVTEKVESAPSKKNEEINLDDIPF